MIRLNRLTDYGIVLMVQLARADRAVRAATQLSAANGVPAPTTAKLLKQLAASGLVRSRRGAGGGYALARPAASITVAEIVAALEGPIALTACVDGSIEHCGVEAYCPMRGNWNRVNRAIQDALNEVTLADMAEPMLPFQPRPRLDVHAPTA
jgi:FeS assembly SUF system regulator